MNSEGVLVFFAFFYHYIEKNGEIIYGFIYVPVYSNVSGEALRQSRKRKNNLDSIEIKRRRVEEGSFHVPYESILCRNYPSSLEE